ncbi:hypothetical protein AS156_28550 [Bradyrhizobium macuxiense]|uniref:Uncharacterized protein n=1 Tax=Bradyrhizobium macuxiense TaxID=1755647 RepID=A0A109K4N9_9BRAD|nr:hypothetical protein AS156_28550 [Bradyrhizobium macuxiense]
MTVERHISLIFAARMQINANEARRIVNAETLKIAHILALRSLAKIFETILVEATDTANVIDLIGRPATINVEPHKMMCAIFSVIDRDNAIALVIHRPNHIASAIFIFIATALPVYSIAKQSRSRAIRQHLPQPLCSQLSHLLSLIKQ